MQFGADPFGASNKTGLKLEKNKNEWIQDPYPNLNPNRYKND